MQHTKAKVGYLKAYRNAPEESLSTFLCTVRVPCVCTNNNNNQQNGFRYRFHEYKTWLQLNFALE